MMKALMTKRRGRKLPPQVRGLLSPKRSQECQECQRSPCRLIFCGSTRRGEKKSKRTIPALE